MGAVVWVCGFGGVALVGKLRWGNFGGSFLEEKLEGRRGQWWAPNLERWGARKVASRKWRSCFLLESLELLVVFETLG